MTIQFLGVSCFKITAKNGNDDVTIVTDPFGEKVGKLPRGLSADLLTVSRRTHEHHNNIEAVGGTPFLIEHAGEYEVKGVPVYGIPAAHEKGEKKEYHENVICQFSIEGVRVVHLGGLQEALTDEQLAQLGEIDVLMVPVGGGDVLDASAAADLVSRIEPRLVIPMHYKAPGLALEAKGAEPFIKEVGAKVVETDKLKLSKKDLPQDETQIVVIKPS